MYNTNNECVCDQFFGFTVHFCGAEIVRIVCVLIHLR